MTSLTREQYDQIAAHVAAGWSNVEIAKAMAVACGRVRYAVRKMGLACAKRRRPKRWTTAKLLRLRGRTVVALMKDYGLTRAAAREVKAKRDEVLAAHGLPRRHRLGALYDRAYNLKRSLRPEHKAYKAAWMRRNRAVKRAEAMVAEA